ncbi:hypothetical protein FDP22_09825 [Paroceanicella profunda]|uniref:Alpha/beta hydrolase n=1 Tax=Paroceanicella profunda TaxID=2579971 RepID=A0A5B8FHC9_9RHOB|nr:hypothetical protein [Paroceanicella profunda]QDL92047.1 hypothetical protein FDP22_09825 [Paroceanicella profunda]
MQDVIDCVRSLVPDGDEKIAYSSSMGAYASFNYAEALGISRGLLVSPQFSVDPKVVPFESRWSRDVARIDFRRDHLRTMTSDVPFSILLDEGGRADAKHARLIRRRVRETRAYSIAGAGHNPLRFLAERGLLKPLVAEYLETGRVMRHEALPLSEIAGPAALPV